MAGAGTLVCAMAVAARKQSVDMQLGRNLEGERNIGLPLAMDAELSIITLTPGFLGQRKARSKAFCRSTPGGNLVATVN